MSLTTHPRSFLNDNENMSCWKDMAIHKSRFSAHQTERSHQHSKSSETTTPLVFQSLPKLHHSSLISQLHLSSDHPLTTDLDAPHQRTLLQPNKPRILRLKEEAEITRLSEMVTLTRLREEAQITLLREELEIARLRAEAEDRLHMLEAEILRSKFQAEIEAGNIRCRADAEVSRCKEYNGVSRFAVTRGENRYSFTVARDRDDVELDIAHGEHVIRLGRSRLGREVISDTQAGEGASICICWRISCYRA
jgi:hypothetical protein